MKFCRNDLTLLASVIWLLTTIIWAITLCADFYYGYTPDGLVILHALCVLTSLTAAVVNFIRWKNKRNDR